MDASSQISSDSVTVIVQFAEGAGSGAPTVLVHGYDGDNGGVDYRISVIAPPLSVGEHTSPDVSFWLTVESDAGSRTYRSDQPQGSGSLVLTEVSDSITVGTFQFEAVHVDDDPLTPDVVSVTGGSLRIRTPALGRAGASG